MHRQNVGLGCYNDHCRVDARRSDTVAYMACTPVWGLPRLTRRRTPITDIRCERQHYFDKGG